MNGMAIAWVYKVNATPRERNVLFTLALYSDENFEAWPGITSISRLSSMKRNSTIQTLNNLVNKGLIIRRQRGGHNITTTYHLNLGVVSKSILESIENDTQLKESLINIESINRVSKSILHSTENDTTPNDSRFLELNDLFMNLSKIVYPRDNQRWIESIEAMIKNGVTPDVMKQAFQDLGNRYTIAGPWSIEKACSNILRKNGNSEYIPEDHASEVYQ